MATIPVRVLDDAVQEGLITDDQRAALLSRAGVADRRSHSPEAEARRGMHPVHVAYSVGAIAVLFGFGWFLADRWTVLGPEGVLAVILVYAGIFAAASVVLRRMGFNGAAGWMLVLAVAMTPIATWTLLEITGVWPARGTNYIRDQWYMGWMQMVLAFSTIAAALITLRFIRVSRVMGEIALAIASALPAVTALLYEQELQGMMSWTFLAGGFALFAVGYALYRQSDLAKDEFYSDSAEWFFAIGLIAVSIGYAMIFQQERFARQLLPVVSGGLLMAAVYLRRRLLLLFGLLGVVAYLAWLAFDVFRQYVGFPAVLATFGTLVILLTVWGQRRYPALVDRVDADRDPSARRTLPGDYITAVLPAVLALVLLVVEVPYERNRVRTQQLHYMRVEHANALRRHKEGGGGGGQSPATRTRVIQPMPRSP